MDEQFSRSEDSWNGSAYESLSEKFQTFLTRAASCRPLFAPSSMTPHGSQSTQSSRTSQVSGASTQFSGRRIILLEDLPNILHAPTQTSFHDALEAFVAAHEASVVPLVLIISDAGLRGEGAEGDVPRWRSRGKEAMDVRNVLPPSLLNSPYVVQITYVVYPLSRFPDLMHLPASIQ